MRGISVSPFFPHNDLFGLFGVGDDQTNVSFSLALGFVSLPASRTRLIASDVLAISGITGKSVQIKRISKSSCQL